MTEGTRTVYFDNCIREIRQSVYGRNNRKPIADAIERVNDSGQRAWHLQEVETEAITGKTGYYRLILHYAGE